MLEGQARLANLEMHGQGLNNKCFLHYEATVVVVDVVEVVVVEVVVVEVVVVDVEVVDVEDVDVEDVDVEDVDVEVLLDDEVDVDEVLLDDEVDVDVEVLLDEVLVEVVELTPGSSTIASRSASSGSGAEAGMASSGDLSK